MAYLKRPLTTRFTHSLALAANIHRLQARKGTQVPYMAHILGVAAIALEHGANEEEAMVLAKAMLAKGAEDGGGGAGELLQPLGPARPRVQRRSSSHQRSLGANTLFSITQLSRSAESEPLRGD